MTKHSFEPGVHMVKSKKDSNVGLITANLNNLSFSYSCTLYPFRIARVCSHCLLRSLFLSFIYHLSPSLYLVSILMGESNTDWKWDGTIPVHCEYVHALYSGLDTYSNPMFPLELLFMLNVVQIYNFWIFAIFHLYSWQWFDVCHFGFNAIRNIISFVIWQLYTAEVYLYQRHG